MGITRGYMRGIGGNPEYYVDYAYKDWYYTQQRTVPKDYHNYTWLFHVPELYVRRAPGMTCLRACEDIIANREVRNDSKGCGGIMRVAPMPLLLAGCTSGEFCPYNIEELALASAKVASCTHKHPLGFLPAALLGVFLYKIAFLNAEEVKHQIKQLVSESLDVIDNVYKEDYEKHRKYLRELTEKSLALALSSMSDEDAIAQLGEGWVAEETWAVALYCAVRYIDSPEQALIVSVNHDGDSDSTGSVTGNIIGLIYGYEYLKERNLLCPEGCELEQILELANIILTIADDLTISCIISEYDYRGTPEKDRWFKRYCEHQPAGI
jgi:ADP-ribosylglycohydrolase